MEVIHLNAEGLKKYCETYGDTIYNVSKDFKGIPEAWKMDTPEGVAEVINEVILGLRKINMTELFNTFL